MRYSLLHIKHWLLIFSLLANVSTPLLSTFLSEREECVLHLIEKENKNTSSEDSKTEVDDKIFGCSPSLILSSAPEYKHSEAGYLRIWLGKVFLPKFTPPPERIVLI